MPEIKKILHAHWNQEKIFGKYSQMINSGYIRDHGVVKG
jgi:hypothetical protein